MSEDNVVFEVKNTVKLVASEQASVELGEALFFYHAWLRDDIELIDIAHEILVTHCKNGANSNYNQTGEYKECERVLSLSNSMSSNFYEFIGSLIYKLSEMITEVYGIEGYHCEFNEGDWGLFGPLNNDDYY